MVTTLISSYYIVPVESYSNLVMLLQKVTDDISFKVFSETMFCCCFQESFCLTERQFLPSYIQLFFSKQQKKINTFMKEKEELIALQSQRQQGRENFRRNAARFLLSIIYPFCYTLTMPLLILVFLSLLVL